MDRRFRARTAIGRAAARSSGVSAKGGIGVGRAWPERLRPGADQGNAVFPAQFPRDRAAGDLPVREGECPDQFPKPVPEAGLRPWCSRAFRNSWQQCCCTWPAGKAGMASVAKTSASRLLPCPKLCSNLQASRAFSVWNVPFSMARPRRAARVTGIAVSRSSGRSAARENLFPFPFVSASSQCSMLILRSRFASSVGNPWSHSKRCTVPVFLSRLSHACFAPPAPNRTDGSSRSPGCAPGTKRKSLSFGSLACGPLDASASSTMIAVIGATFRELRQDSGDSLPNRFPVPRGHG